MHAPGLLTNQGTTGGSGRLSAAMGAEKKAGGQSRMTTRAWPWQPQGRRSHCCGDLTGRHQTRPVLSRHRPPSSEVAPTATTSRHRTAPPAVRATGPHPAAALLRLPPTADLPTAATPPGAPRRRARTCARAPTPTGTARRQNGSQNTRGADSGAGLAQPPHHRRNGCVLRGRHHRPRPRPRPRPGRAPTVRPPPAPSSHHHRRA